MKHRIIFSLLLLSLFFVSSGAAAGQTFDKSAYYAALSSDNLDEINEQLAVLKTANFSDKDAYEGTLQMKKAGLVGNTKEKLSLFKSGRSKLEASISRDAENAEYRFLRLIIQEHAPKIVKYKSNIEEDSRIVQSNFKTLPSALQQVIKDYSKKSKVLKTS